VGLPNSNRATPIVDCPCQQPERVAECLQIQSIATIIRTGLNHPGRIVNDYWYGTEHQLKFKEKDCQIYEKMSED